MPSPTHCCPYCGWTGSQDAVGAHVARHLTADLVRERDEARAEVERWQRAASDIATDLAYEEVVTIPRADDEIDRLTDEVERLQAVIQEARKSDAACWALDIAERLVAERASASTAQEPSA